MPVPLMMTRDPVDTVGGQAFTNRLDHRNTARHGRFERNNDALLTGLGEDFVTVNSDQRLVGGYHVLAILDRFEYQLAGDGIATDQLDDDVDFRVGGHVKDVGRDRSTGSLELGLWRTHSDLCHFDSTPGTTSNLLGVTLKHVEGTATDSTQPTDAYFDRFHYELPIKRPTRGRP